MRSVLFLPVFFLAATPGPQGAGLCAAQQIPQPFEATWYGFNTQDQVGTTRYFLENAKLADIDNDGDLDVVAPTAAINDFSGPNGFVVLKNDGTGAFASPPAHYPLSRAPGYVEVADLNNDGLRDVVTANTGSTNQGNTISVFLNLGNGIFGSPTSYAVGTAPQGIAAADFDGNGTVDLAVANYAGGLGNTISVLMNNGAGVFSAAASYPAGDAPFRVAAGRINADQAVDLVVANGWVNGGASINVLLNPGNGHFTSRTEYVANGRATFPSVAIADVDNDGDNDVLFPFFDFNNGAIVNLYRNQGDGTFTVQPIQMDPYTVIADIAAADLDGDGWPDIVAASASARTTDGYEVAMNNGAGSFSFSYRNPAGEYTAAVMLGDADRDGRTDILTVDSYTMQITVHKNFGHGTFPLPILSDLAATQTAGSVDAADIDGDGLPDVVVSASGRAGVGVPVKVLRNHGDGTFGPPIDYSVRDGGVRAKFRDLNGDGRPDLLYATAISSPPYDFHYAMNRGDGTFGPVQTKSIGACGWYDIEAVDLNNDGLRDVVVSEPLGCQDIPDSGRRLFICLNNGNGTFADPIIALVGPHPMPLGYGDFNHDGNEDLVSGVSGGIIEVCYGIGNGDVQPPVQYPIGDEGGADGIAVADFNQDGNLDIASDNLLGFGTYTMSVLYGNGDTTFRPALVLPSPQSPDLLNVSGITVGDFDDDGDTDIMVGNYASHTLSLYTNEISTFHYSPVRAGVYWGLYAPFFADFDNDGRGDLVAVGELSPSGLYSTLLFLKGTRTNPAGTPPAGLPASLETRLEQNAPDPFRGSTLIRFWMPAAGRATVRIFDVTGRTVATPVDGYLAAGSHTAQWIPDRQASGLYYCRLSAGGTGRVRQMHLLH